MKIAVILCFIFLVVCAVYGKKSGSRKAKKHHDLAFDETDCTEAESATQNCLNGGACKKIDWGDAFNLICRCGRGYSGWQCQFEDPDCSAEEATQQACQNGGTCKKNDYNEDGVFNYVCVCPRGYSGMKCETEE